MPGKTKKTTTTTTAAISTRSWWKGVLQAKWGLGYVRHHQAVAPSPAAATKASKLKLGAWLASRWKKTAQFRSKMRWGSLSYIATKLEEDQLASTGGCNGLQSRAKADSGTCDSSAMAGDASSPASAAFFRRRVVQGLILGAIVAATIYAVYRRRRHKPSRPRPRRQLDGDNSGAAATASDERWWKAGGRCGRSGSDGSITSDAADEGSGGTGGETGDGGGITDEDKNPELTRAGKHDLGAGNAGGNISDREERNGGGACPSMSPESGEPAPTFCPSPEHDREKADGFETVEDEESVKQARHVLAEGKSGQQTGKKPAEVESQCGIVSAGNIGDATRNGDIRPPKDDLLSTSGPSLSSASSSEELLAEVDNLIANRAFSTSRSTGATKRTSATGANRSSRSRAARRVKTNKFTGPRGSSGRSNVTRDMSSPGRPRDTRSPKRARVYREMTGEEIDALVSLTNRALDRDPAALSEIAEDASLQEGGEGGMSIGGLADNASAVWDEDGGRGTSGVNPRTPTLWSDSSGPDSK